MTKTNTQKAEILWFLNNNRGSRLTQLAALQDFGCFRLAAVVFRLRKEGYPVLSEQVPGESYHAYWISR